MYKHICLKCGVEFYNRKQNSIFCSWECYKKSERAKRDKGLVEVKCAECGKTEYVYPSRSKKYLCCSVQCLGKYNSKKYSKKVILTCPICGEEYECKQSKINHHRTCGKSECKHKWKSKISSGRTNPNYRSVEDFVKSHTTSGIDHEKQRTIYQHIVKEVLGFERLKDLPKGYVIHHKDANHENNSSENLVMIPKSAHRLIHTVFGNIMINALHTGKIDRDTFFKMCNEDQANFYKEIIDLNILNQVIVKQGESTEFNDFTQSTNVYKNIYV